MVGGGGDHVAVGAHLEALEVRSTRRSGADPLQPATALDVPGRHRAAPAAHEDPATVGGEGQRAAGTRSDAHSLHVAPLRPARRAHVPHRGRGQPIVPDQDPAAVRREGHALEAVAGVLAGEAHPFPHAAVGDLGDARRAVVAHRGQAGPVGAPVQAVDGPDVRRHRESLFAAVRPPDPGRGVAAGRRDPSAVGAVGHIADPELARSDREQLLAGVVDLRHRGDAFDVANDDPLAVSPQRRAQRPRRRGSPSGWRPTPGRTPGPSPRPTTRRPPSPRPH